jgi:DNA-binding NarL/FixJ family response regulator
MISIVIVDDHQIFRDGLKLLFDNTPDMQVIAEAESGADALEKLAGLEPDLILMDIHMPDKNGIDVTRELKQRNPAHKILILTMFEDNQSVFAAMRAGALGYVLKGVNHAEMIQTVRIAVAGGVVFSAQIAEHILQWFGQGGKQPAKVTAVELPELTQREQAVLELVAAGCDNPTIADRLTVTEKTVRNYVSQLLKKLEVNDRQAAAEKARRAGMDEL